VVCLVDGEAVESLPTSDSSIIRGDGCFEAVRSYGGNLFRLDDHLDRLDFSAAALGLMVPSRDSLYDWTSAVAAGRDDCVVRIILTRGPAVPGAEGSGRCVVMSHPLPPSPGPLRLLPVAAPWHPAGRPWQLAGVKTISYAPNLAASRQAGDAGFDDALLISDDAIVLEGPTFSVGWIQGGTIYTPSLELGILASITRRVVMEVTEVKETVAALDVVVDADEVFVMSTLKEVTPVTALGDRAFAVGSRTRELRQRVKLVVETMTPH
jgi:branched-chain amino acid aminotransferase